MTKRRGNGEDSIYKDGDRWRGAVSVGYDDKGRRVRKKVSGRTRAEVARKLKEVRNAVDAGTVPDDQITVKAFLERWVLVNLPGTVAESTEDDYGDMVRLHLVPALGRKKLNKLTVAEVDRLWSSKLEAGYAANSRRNMRTVLRRALTQAEKEGLVVRNVAALSAAPRTAQREGRTLTLNQAKSLLKSVESHRYGSAITVALAYGLRRGEVLGLRWENLDWEAGTLRLTHAVKRIKNRDKNSDRKTRIVINELKTAKSRRTLVLTPEIITKLRTLHADQAKTRLSLGEQWRDHGLIFPSVVGTPTDPDNFSHTFSKLAKRAKLGHWHPHELRHSGASLMLAQGTPLHVVSEILGHAGIAITKDTYGHLVVDDKRAAAEAMSGALFGG